MKQINKEGKLNFTKIKTFVLQKILLSELKKSQTEKKIAKYIYDEIQKSENTKFQSGHRTM